MEVEYQSYDRILVSLQKKQHTLLLLLEFETLCCEGRATLHDPRPKEISLRT
jgi:hypothetical protein